MDIRTLIRAQSLLFAHNQVFFERRHHDLLKLQRYAHTINEKEKEEEGSSLLLGREDDPAEEETLQRFIQNINHRSPEELEQDLSPRSRKLHRGIFP